MSFNCIFRLYKCSVIFDMFGLRSITLVFCLFLLFFIHLSYLYCLLWGLWTFFNICFHLSFVIWLYISLHVFSGCSSDCKILTFSVYVESIFYYSWPLNNGIVKSANISPAPFLYSQKSEYNFFLIYWIYWGNFKCIHSRLHSRYTDSEHWEGSLDSSHNCKPTKFQ